MARQNSCQPHYPDKCLTACVHVRQQNTSRQAKQSNQ